ncbi:hypothetical protein [Telmatospirillum siberiense]|uniref:Uncharacterized protein n=1 Tax=Telmatospirillum siberiense TaxID=382514 RepID=A0A2N3Q170_9PROT|nr:hypothetical protein [Telmatospirillum siberiense]PKU26408.1 hypothetical protein CWS72_00720 [Telmatospirillum siberiense]
MLHVIVHTPADTLAALEAAEETGVHPILHSSAVAAQSLGAGYFLAMIEDARRRHPSAQCLAVLDCGTACGLALAALRGGVEAVSLDAPPAVLAKIADVAAQTGACLAPTIPDDALDLRNHPDPLAACRASFTGTGRDPRASVIEPPQND